MGAAYENFTGPLEDEFVQDLTDSEGWIFGTVIQNTERQSRAARFLSKVPIIGKHFAVIDQIPAESEV